MAYQIDFTARNYVARWWRKLLLRLLVLATITGAAWGVHYVYAIYNQPTLNMRLAEYEAASRPIEEMNAAWDTAAKEYNALMRYYRLIWAANPTNFLEAMIAKDAPRLGRGFRPQRWSLATGGECELAYRYVFSHGDKAGQSNGLEAKVANAVTSVVKVVGGKVDVQGVQHENLLGVEELNIKAKFSLPNVMSFPAKERALADCVNEIVAMRKKVHESKISDGGDVKGTTAQDIMITYLPMGKDKPDFPEMSNVINVSGWLDRADQFIVKNRIPGDDAERKRLKASWNKVGDARFPWDRFRVLDNNVLVNRIEMLGTVSDGVRRFKGVLDKRHGDCRKKLEPFVESYDHNKVFNEPIVESDLVDRFAKSAGIVGAKAAFKDEPGAEPAVLVKEDEKFTFTWVRWTLSVGEESDPEKPLTLERLMDCIRRTLKQPGPGYALDKVTIDFDEDGNVSDAVLEGLLPVKKKEATANVD